jgi:zinc/manganese transport system permease protein
MILDGVSTRRMELCYLLVMALAASMTVPVVGALLMFALMIGPAEFYAGQSMKCAPTATRTRDLPLRRGRFWSRLRLARVAAAAARTDLLPGAQ